MALCLRSVSNRLCCGNYSNIARLVHSACNNLNLTSGSANVGISEMNNFTKSLAAESVPINFRSAYRISQCSYGQDQWSGKLSNKSALLQKCSEFLYASRWSKEPNNTEKPKGRPSEDQLEVVFNNLSQTLPNVLNRGLEYHMYHKDIILENNFNGTRYVGLTQYVFRLALLRALANFKFAYCRLDILKMTKHPEDGTIKCRWRLVGIPTMRVIFQFWKFAPSSNTQKGFKGQMNNAPTWFDGFSVYYVGSEGTIIKHIIDKMQPDDDRVQVETKSSMTPKVTL